MDRLWTRAVAGAGDMKVTSIVRDPSGDLLIAGEFAGTIDFGPTPGVLSLTATGAKDVFVARQDSEGRFLWARRFGGNGATQIAANGGLAAAASVPGEPAAFYVGGSFVGTTDFDPGPGVFALTSVGALDVFVVKIDGDGNLIWAQRSGGPSGTLNVNAMAAGAGGVFLVGYCGGNLVIGGRTVCSATGVNAFLLAMNATTGAFAWILQDHSFTAAAQSVFAADDGTIVYAGNQGGAAFLEGVSSFGTAVWEHLVSFDGILRLTGDPQGGFYVAGVAAGDAVVMKCNAAGATIWETPLGVSHGSLANSIRPDTAGNVYVAGEFSGTFLGDTVSMVSHGQSDAFVMGLDPTGTVVWSEDLGGVEADEAKDLVPDDNHNVYAVGTFRATADFDPGPAVYNLTSAGAADGFVWKFGRVDITLDATTPTLIHFSPVDPDPTFDIVTGLLSALRSTRDYSAAGCLGIFTGNPAQDAAIPPAGDGFYYLARGRSCCTAEGYGVSSLVPDPREALNIAGLCP